MLVSYLFQNKYTIVLTPLITLLLILYLLKEEIRTTDFNLILLNTANLELSYYAFAVAIISQGICNFLLSPEPNLSMKAMTFIPVMSVYTVLVAPVLEEIVFRKIIYGELQKRYNDFSYFAATFSSLLFALFHFSMNGFLGYFAVGVVFCFYFNKSKTIYVTIIAHAMINLSVVIVQSLRT
ncbi:CPBP family intramembrane glutamic endopeptidase [Paenibacillus radicibacter]|uniref:CPBP family intramembrane glutamic endopeptidase n=1 Tax=Paenibacillus radicibacter TaxID=2972488 RepID=UPI00358F2A87